MDTPPPLAPKTLKLIHHQQQQQHNFLRLPSAATEPGQVAQCGHTNNTRQQQQQQARKSNSRNPYGTAYDGESVPRGGRGTPQIQK
ncbi:hypothetical protein niasHT_004271 [Heterodera trifolii]|uniref:Uncharacterized protein n=1 Tax=Heterodera trifolii TaxID=157864 RepID=A0ABD2LQ36_9BILA